MKTKIDVQLILVPLLIILAISAALKVTPANADQIIYTIEAGEFEIIEDAQGFHRIYMPDYGMVESPGDPILPEKTFEFWVPEDIIWPSVNLTVEINAMEELTASYNIPPNPPLGPVSVNNSEYDPEYEEWGLEKSIVEGRNTYVYERDANYPEQSVELIPHTERKEHRLLLLAAEEPAQEFEENNYIRLAYRPFLYNPVKQQLTFIQEVSVIITYHRIMEPPAARVSSDSTYDYVIITTNNIVSNSEKLAYFINLKELYGHSVKVVTETDFGGLTGQAPNGRAEKIRQWLKNNYQSLGIDYVLLIGDPDPDDPSNPSDSIGDIPMKMCWPRYFSWKYRESPTDYFYADLTGDWDLDGDEYFGEGLDLNHIVTPDPTIGQDTFSARWTGEVMCDFTDTYTFHTFSDAGVRLYIDGSLIIDNWPEHLPTSDYAVVPMTAGRHDIELEFREDTDEAIIQLRWRCQSKGHPHYVPHQIIPTDHLYDASDTVGGLTGTYYDNADFTGPSITRKDAVINFIWGTGDTGANGPDSGAEVFVGRIPVYNDDYGQLDEILQKIIEYETDPDDISWRRTILLPMKPLWDDTPSYHLGEGIRSDFATAAGFTSFRIYEEDYNPPTPELHPCTKINVKNEWKDGYGMVTWTTHGGPEGASGVFDSTMTHELDDAKPSFTFQASCLNGYPENNNNLGYSLLREGAIATVSASRVSWDSHGSWTFNPHSASNHHLAYYYTKKVIHGAQSAGVALYLTKGDVPSMGMNLMDYNLYGDPDCYLLTTIPNIPPTADAGGPYIENEGTSITFDASGSSDPDGDPLQYRWDFGNDGIWDTAWSNDPTATHTWPDDHTGTAKVEVSDGLVTSTDTSDVTVLNVAPTATIDSMIQPNPQFILPIVHTLTFTGSFTDPGWLDTHTATWDFGDGTVVPGTLVEENVEPDATGTTTADHVYSDPGIYTVTLTITDDDGGVGTDTMQVTVSSYEEAKEDINDYIQSLADDAFRNNANHRKKALANMFSAIDHMLDDEGWKGAIQDLRNNIRAKTDGSVDGTPNNDWIIDPTAQQEICMKIDDLTAYLETFL